MLPTSSVLAAGIEISVERAGSGPSLIWGHGLTSSMLLEREVISVDWETIRRRADVVRYDARGHGNTTTTDELAGYGWDALAADQLALASELGIGSYIASGASMGAGTALHAAVNAPERIGGLLLVIPPTGWEMRAAQRDIYLGRAELIEQGDLDGVIAAARTIPPPDPFGAEWHDRLARTLRSADLSRMAHVLRGAATTNMPSVDELSAISVPTTILGWTGDPGHPVASAERLADLIADSRLVIASAPEDLMTWTDEVLALIERVRINARAS